MTRLIGWGSPAGEILRGGRLEPYGAAAAV